MTGRDKRLAVTEPNEVYEQAVFSQGDDGTLIEPKDQGGVCFIDLDANVNTPKIVIK